jgi:hypothetical protein
MACSKKIATVVVVGTLFAGTVFSATACQYCCASLQSVQLQPSDSRPNNHRTTCDHGSPSRSNLAGAQVEVIRTRCCGSSCRKRMSPQAPLSSLEPQAQLHTFIELFRLVSELDKPSLTSFSPPAQAELTAVANAGSSSTVLRV